MALNDFEHIRPSTLDEAASLADSRRDGAVLVAGGTDLLGIMKDKVHPKYPKLLIDIKAIPDLAFVREDETGLRIGALTTLSEIAHHPALRGKYPLLAEAARAVASPQLRNMGTIGGNICQEPRCWYYRNPDNRFQCLRKGGGKCNAISGENRFHSIFGAARVGTPGCRAECPGKVDIALYLSYVREGNLDGAARIFLQSNPMAPITGRVCPHFCEGGCNRSEIDSAVSIRAIERRLGDYILENAERLMPPPKVASGKKVAVVGSGPAGLSAAFYLRRAGHEVRVFERMPKAGGMLAYAIPAYRLPGEIVQKLVGAYERMGIVFELNADVGGAGNSIASLRERFDGVFLATGAWGQRTIKIPGAELLESGLDFLVEIRKGNAKSSGERVLVIGGGNVAVDVAISAKRLGAKEVTMASLEARDIMPAFPEEIEEALNEGVKLAPSWGPSKVIQRDGKVTGMELVYCTSVFDADGQFHPSYDPGRKMIIDADRILLAVGQGTELSYLPDSIKTQRGLVIAGKDDQATSADAVYAGGDVVTGPASIAEAYSAGRRAAEAINERLAEGKIASRRDSGEGGKTFHEIKPETMGEIPRSFVPALTSSRRDIATEDAPTMSATEIENEARRCLDCGCVAVNASDLAPALIALGASIKTTRRSLQAEDFFAALPMRTTVLDAAELVTEIDIPTPAAGTVFGFQKFRIRNSIDFPIVSVASALTLKDGLIQAASVVFGAVAPVPLRALRVEEFLRGRKPGEETAEAAASIAARGTYPLGCNGYKIQVLRALVKKAILAAGP